MFELATPRRLEMPKKISGGVDVEVFSRGDVSIFATNHTATFLSPTSRVQIHSSLRTCDNLLYEGDTTSQRRMYEFPSYAGEKYVMDTFTKRHPKNTHPLEEGCNIFELVGRHGMDKNEMGTYILLKNYIHPILAAKDVNAAEKAIDFGIKNALSIQDNFESLNVSEVRRRLMNIFKNKYLLPSTIDNAMLAGILQAAASFAIIYRGFLSEYEYIGPTIKHLMKELPGRKAIVIGKMHLEAVEKALENEEFVEPPEWATFIKSLDATRFQIVEVTRKLMELNM